MARGNPLYIDLHGYREEEIEQLLDTVTDMLREQFDRRTPLRTQATTSCGPSASRAASAPPSPS